MKKFKIVCYVIGAVQIVLGVLYLLTPSWFISWQGLTVPAENIHYPLAMFAARLLVYGAGMFAIAHKPQQNKFWLDGMIGIQLIDLIAGIYYTSQGIISLAISGFPMFNATLIIVLLLWMRPEDIAPNKTQLN